MTATTPTSIALHPMPARGSIVREQIAAVGIAIRKERNTFLGILAAFAALAIWSAFRARTEFHQASIDYAPGATIPMTLIALLIPFGVWRSSDRERRGYDWAMPVAQSTHTIIRMLAGWLWLMLGVAIYLAVIVLFQVVMIAIMGGSVSVNVPAWQWLVPFTSVSIAYLLTSTAMIGSEHPWRWIGGIIIGYLIAMLVLEVLKLQDMRYALQQVVGGYYGLAAAIFGDLRAPHEFASSSSRWLVATLIWGVLSIAGVWLAARRHSTS